MTEEAFKMLGWVNFETQRKAHKRILVFKCLNDLVTPYLSSYFIRNHTIHTHATRQNASPQNASPLQSGEQKSQQETHPNHMSAS